MNKTLADWLAHLEGLHPKGQGGIELGLERVGRVKAELGQAQTCPLITVGGTNGKGSTCATLEAIYRCSGYRVGCYTSPHLLAYNERVRVDGVPVDDAALCAAFARVESARQAAGNVALTYFEFGTLAAWEVFAARKVQVTILEVGLGGRLDAVNVYDADVAVVTGIALDHTDWLGPTRETIGFEKAGIFRAEKPAICGDRQPPQSLLTHAADTGADLRLIGRDFGYVRDDKGCDGWSFWNRAGQSRKGLPLPILQGEHQFANASVVLAVVDALEECLPVSLPALKEGLREVRLAGRFQRVRECPAIVLDVAHNPQAVTALAQNLANMGRFRQTIAVVGMLADKDIAGALIALSGKIDVWFLAGLDVPRGASAEVLAGIVGGVEGNAGLGGRMECLASPDAAFLRAVGLAGENDRIVVFGSFYTVAAALRVIAQDS